MIKLILLVISTLIIFSGCSKQIIDSNVDRHAHETFTGLFNIKNETAETIHVSEIYSTDEVYGYFYLSGESIPPQGVSTMNISFRMHFEIRSGLFEINGICGKNENWKIKGTHLERSFVNNEMGWIITIIIKDCDAGDEIYPLLWTPGAKKRDCPASCPSCVFIDGSSRCALSELSTGLR